MCETHTRYKIKNSVALSISWNRDYLDLLTIRINDIKIIVFKMIFNHRHVISFRVCLQILRPNYSISSADFRFTVRGIKYESIIITFFRAFVINYKIITINKYIYIFSKYLIRHRRTYPWGLAHAVDADWARSSTNKIVIKITV